MILSLAIISISMVLMAYWFRYVCCLILETRSNPEFSRALATRIRLNLFDVQEKLRAGNRAGLDVLDAMLMQDYQMLTSLMDEVGGVENIERKLLATHFKIQQFRFRVTRALAVNQSRNALLEMSNVVSFFAGAVGQSAAS